MSKQFLAIIAAIIIAFVGIFALQSKKSETGSKSGSKTLTNHVEGNNTTGVTFTEYGDYQCPYCQQYFATVKQVQDQFKDQIAFQFRNYPLVNAHPNAFAAARAAEAAALQNKFWEMHDLLYENNDPTGQAGWVPSKDPTTFFDQFAQQLGLNMTKFKADFASIKVNDLINADMAEGNRLGITGTPSFYINGKAVQIANSPDSFSKVIKAAIAAQPKKSSTTSTTTTPANTDPTATTPSTDTTAQTPTTANQ